MATKNLIFFLKSLIALTEESMLELRAEILAFGSMALATESIAILSSSL